MPSRPVLIDEIKFKCPYCSRNASIGKLESTGEDFLIHADPPCRRFVECEFPEYIEASAPAIATTLHHRVN